MPSRKTQKGLFINVWQNRPVCSALSGATEYIRVDAGELNDVELQRQPAFANHDFVAFDTNSHSFTVTAEAARRLAREFNGGKQKVRADGKLEYFFDAPDAPFLLMAMGERIYLGALKSVLSSWGYSVPVIEPEATSIGVDETNDVRFLIMESFPHAPASPSRRKGNNGTRTSRFAHYARRDY
jgi:hypothetical protein